MRHGGNARWPIYPVGNDWVNPWTTIVARTTMSQMVTLPGHEALAEPGGAALWMMFPWGEDARGSLCRRGILESGCSGFWPRSLAQPNGLAY